MNNKYNLTEQELEHLKDTFSFEEYERDYIDDNFSDEEIKFMTDMYNSFMKQL